MSHESETFAERLDRLLAEPHAAPPSLADRILENLPAQSRPPRLLDGLLPSTWDGGLWRPATVALALGVALGLGAGTQAQQAEDAHYGDVLVLAFSASYVAVDAYEGLGDE